MRGNAFCRQHCGAVEPVLQDAGDRFGKAYQGLLNVWLMVEPVLGAGLGRVLGEHCSLLAAVSLVQHLLRAAVDCVDNGLVLWQNEKAAVVSFIFSASTAKLE